MKKRSIYAFASFALIATLIGSCAPTTSPSGSNDQTGNIIPNDYSKLNVTATGYLNGAEDSNKTAAEVEVETKDNITGVVIINVKLKATYGIWNIVARDSERTVNITKSTKVGSNVKIYLQLANSDLDVKVYLGKDVTSYLPTEGWDALAEAITSPIVAANISSDDMNTYLNQSLNYSSYFYKGKTKEGNSFSTQHNFYSSMDFESNTFVNNPTTGAMAQVYLGADNKINYYDASYNDGSMYPWFKDDEKYFNASNGEDMNMSPYQETPLSVFAVPKKGKKQTINEILKDRFRATATGDGNVIFTNKTSNTDVALGYSSIFPGSLLFSFNNNVYGAYMRSQTNFSTVKITMSLGDYKIQGITITQPWVFNAMDDRLISTQWANPSDYPLPNDKTFTFKAELTAWNDRPYDDGYNGSWVKENGNVSSIFKDFSYMDPTPTPLKGNASENLADSPLIAKLREGNYSVDVKTTRISSDGWFDGVGDADAPFEGTLKVNVSDDTTNPNKGVVSTLPTVTSRDSGTLNANGYYNSVNGDGTHVSVYGKVDGTSLKAYGVTNKNGSNTFTSLSTQPIPLTALFKGDNQGFNFAKEYFDEEGSFKTDDAVFTGNFFDNNVMSAGQARAVWKQLASPLDFAFGQNPFADTTQDSKFSDLYGYMGSAGSIKKVIVDFKTPHEINITYNGSIRLYGETNDFTVTYRYYDIGTTDLTKNEATILGQIK